MPPVFTVATLLAFRSGSLGGNKSALIFLFSFSSFPSMRIVIRPLHRHSTCPVCRQRLGTQQQEQQEEEADNEDDSDTASTSGESSSSEEVLILMVSKQIGIITSRMFSW